MPWNVAIQGKHHTDIRKLSGYHSTVSDALKCCHSRQISHWYQEAIWISVHCLWCLEMLPFTANIILISGSYLDISPVSLMPWNVAIQGKHHTDIRKLSGYQSTISDALKCCHSRQASYWYQEVIWISVHCLRCLEMLPITASIILISGSYLDISLLYLMPWNVAIQGKHHTDIREAIWISVHYIWCLEMLPFKANITLISGKLYGYQSTISDALKCCHSRQTSHWYQGSYLDISPLSLMPWNVAIHGKYHTDIRKLSGYKSTISDALKCCHSRQTSHWYQEAIWISFHYFWCLEMLTFQQISLPEVGGGGHMFSSENSIKSSLYLLWSPSTA